jgi:hypothetical protein
MKPPIKSLPISLYEREEKVFPLLSKGGEADFALPYL